MNRLVLVGGILWLVACSNTTSSDGGVPDVPTSDVPGDGGPDLGDGGAACSSADGYTTCSGGYGVTCCDGVESRFADGPCWPGIDAGLTVDAGSPCEADPQAPGCPCTTEGEVACRLYQWRHECHDGEWTVAVGYVCC